MARRPAEATPPVARMLEKGVKVSAGTDATRVASYNPWVSLAWLISGKTLAGLKLYPQRNCLDRNNRFAHVDRKRDVVLERGRPGKGASKSGSTPTWWCPTAISCRARKPTSPTRPRC